MTKTANTLVSTCSYLGPDYDPRDAKSRTSPTPFCGCATLAGKSYCAEHYPVVYNVGSALRKRHKDVRVKTSIEDLCQLIIDINEELEDEGWTPDREREELAV